MKIQKLQVRHEPHFRTREWVRGREKWTAERFAQLSLSVGLENGHTKILARIPSPEKTSITQKVVEAENMFADLVGKHVFEAVREIELRTVDATFTTVALSDRWCRCGCGYAFRVDKPTWKKIKEEGREVVCPSCGNREEVYT